MNIEQQIADYKPYNEQEAHDQAVMRQLLATQPDLFTRENEVAHMTASSWLLNATHDKVLMIYHNIYHSWAWTGGHADGDRDLLAVAKREAMEETGVTEIRAISEDIFSLEILTVDGHEKRGVYVPSHLHLNVSYLLEADEEEVLRIKPDENSGEMCIRDSSQTALSVGDAVFLSMSEDKSLLHSLSCFNNLML